jgi:molybdate transport system substrate-binding protein
MNDQKDWDLLTAGSISTALRGVITDMENRSTWRPPRVLAGPAGWLAERILAGERADLFISASPVEAKLLLDRLPYQGFKIFARNALAIVTRPGLAVTEDTVLELLSRPGTRIGMSTPGQDPAGTYALTFLEAYQDQLPNGRDLPPALGAVAMFGGAGTTRELGAPSPALMALLSGQVDVILCYATTAREILEQLPGTAMVVAPKALAPVVEYALVLHRNAPPFARILADALSEERAQKRLRNSGFIV